MTNRYKNSPNKPPSRPSQEHWSDESDVGTFGMEGDFSSLNYDDKGNPRSRRTYQDDRRLARGQIRDPAGYRRRRNRPSQSW